MQFAVIRHDQPDSLALRLSERPRHLEYLEKVQHRILYGGALLDDNGKQIGSVLIIHATDRADALAFADADPYVKAGLFVSTIVQAFRPVFKDGVRI